ncbi:unnamed protein product [Linum trigynum]|uniref:Uncharacterized protein n=1 Tax=Linum trigynum TaxID=586398 RepID=A0AAV2GNP7_9ROSI
MLTWLVSGGVLLMDNAAFTEDRGKYFAPVIMMVASALGNLGILIKLYLRRWLGVWFLIPLPSWCGCIVPDTFVLGIPSLRLRSVNLLHMAGGVFFLEGIFSSKESGGKLVIASLSGQPQIHGFQQHPLLGLYFGKDLLLQALSYPLSLILDPKDGMRQCCGCSSLKIRSASFKAFRSRIGRFRML